MLGVKQLVKLAKKKIIDYVQEQPNGELHLTLSEINNFISEDGYEIEISSPVGIVDAKIKLKKK
jgi:hypothetical protein